MTASKFDWQFGAPLPASPWRAMLRCSLQYPPTVNVVGIRAATATIECQMVSGMLGEAPVADEFCRQPIVARVGAGRQDGKRCRDE